MAMNREQKRQLRRQGEVDEEGAPVRTRRQPTRQVEERTSPGQFVKEVRSELRKVVWPTRAETINYSIVVLVAIVFVTALIAGLDWVFSDLILKLFDA